ncbi:Vacuolar sorting ATPAse protein [Neofusicoccum parvum]|nr:Vacuolar sorting ATPAse protein [Neofusicoccum parvum]
MSGTDFLGRAIDVVKKAIDKDTNGDYESAYQLYYQALELFMLALKWEKNAKSKEMIRAKVGEYMERAEKLKNHLAENDTNNRKKPGAIGANGKVAGGSGKGQGGGDEEEDADSKKLRGALAGAILSEKPNVRWEDVAGLDQAKEALKEAVILPIKFPHLFTGKRQPWKGILMYGPPGTGKSYLAKAVATEANSTFFSVSSSDLVSKWMGESERLVKQLFNMARENKPSIIFIDEIDALCGPRGEGESEASRRIKTELLVQMDGVGKDSKGVLILGATNIPWQLDAAIRRRFQRRVHISLPDLPARVKMFELAVGTTPCFLKPEDYRELGRLSEGYSGSDISIAVQDALMQPVRKIQTATHYKKVTVDGQEKLTPCSPGDAGAMEMQWTDVDSEALLEPPLMLKDFIKAIKGSRPTVSGEDLTRNAEWTKEFGSEGAGAGGSSAAYYLSQYAASAGIPTNITIFEREPYIGGRSTTVHAYDAPSIPVELGASIFVSVNRILMEAVSHFNLSSDGLSTPIDNEEDEEGQAQRDYVGVWDGHSFVFTAPDDMGWWDKARLLWKYGLAPIRTMRLMKKTVGAFLQMYEEPHFPFPSLSEKAHELGLVEATAATGEEFLRKNGIGEAFAHDVVQASTRVNYAQNLPLINGLISMVCMATDGAMSVDGGNWQIFANMARAATQDIRLNTSVSALVKQSDATYTLIPQNASTRALRVPEHFDAVVLAAPHQFANLSITPAPRRVPDAVPYVSLHVTLFTSPHRLAPAAFNLAPGAAVPQVILTTLAPGDRPGNERQHVGDAGFFSISALRRLRNPATGRAEHLYKIFSPAPVTGGFLAKILGVQQDSNDDGESAVGEELGKEDVSWVYRKVWQSYPYELPRVTFEEYDGDECVGGEECGEVGGG